MDYEFDDSINHESIPKIKRAIAAHLTERPKDTLYMRVKVFTGKLVMDVPVLGLLYEVQCIAVGGKIILRDRMILWYSAQTSGWVITAARTEGVQA